MTLRRDAIARQTSAWLFTLSEDENRVIANVVDRVRKAVPQYGHLDIRADKRDWQSEAGAEILDFLFYVGCEWLKQRVARVDAVDSAPADTVVPHDGERTHGGNCQGGGKVHAPGLPSESCAGSSPAPDTIRDGEKPGGRPSGPYETQQGATTPGQCESAAAGNVAASQRFAPGGVVASPGVLLDWFDTSDVEGE